MVAILHFKCLDKTHKTLEVQFDAIRNSTSSSNDTTLLSNTSISQSCSRCYNADINAYATNYKSIQALEKEIARFNVLVKYGCIKTYQFKDALYKTVSGQRNKKRQEFRFDAYESKSSERVIVNGKECLKFIKECRKPHTHTTQHKPRR